MIIIKWYSNQQWGCAVLQWATYDAGRFSLQRWSNQRGPMHSCSRLSSSGPCRLRGTYPSRKDTTERIRRCICGNDDFGDRFCRYSCRCIASCHCSWRRRECGCFHQQILIANFDIKEKWLGEYKHYVKVFFFWFWQISLLWHILRKITFKNCFTSYHCHIRKVWKWKKNVLSAFTFVHIDGVDSTGMSIFNFHQCA